MFAFKGTASIFRLLSGIIAMDSGGSGSVKESLGRVYFRKYHGGGGGGGGVEGSVSFRGVWV